MAKYLCGRQVLMSTVGDALMAENVIDIYGCNHYKFELDNIPIA